VIDKAEKAKCNNISLHLFFLSFTFDPFKYINYGTSTGVPFLCANGSLHLQGVIQPSLNWCLHSSQPQWREIRAALFLGPHKNYSFSLLLFRCWLL